jgi:hypothetical protein
MSEAVSQLKVQDLIFDQKEIEEKQRSEHLQVRYNCS